MEKKGPVFTANMLGGLSFYYGDEAFTIKCNNTSKVMQLFLILLGAGDEGIPRVQLLEALYGRDDTQDTKNAFRILVFRIMECCFIVPSNDFIIRLFRQNARVFRKQSVQSFPCFFGENPLK